MSEIRSKTLTLVGVAMLAVLATTMAVKNIVTERTEDKVKQALGRASILADLDFDDVSVDLLGANAHIHGLTVRPPGSRDGMRVDRLTIYDIDADHEVPLFAHAALTGITISSAFLPVGYDPIGPILATEEILKGSLDVDYQYEPESQRLRLSKLSVGVDSFGSVTLSLDATNVNIQSDSWLEFLSNLSTSLINDAELEYVDDGFLAAFIVQQAVDEGKSLQEVINSVAETMDRAVPDNGSSWTLSQALTEPGSVRVRFEPTVPIPGSRLIMNFGLERRMASGEVRFDYDGGGTSLLELVTDKLAGLKEEAQDALENGRWELAIENSRLARVLIPGDDTSATIEADARTQFEQWTSSGTVDNRLDPLFVDNPTVAFTRFGPFALGLPASRIPRAANLERETNLCDPALSQTYSIPYKQGTSFSVTTSDGTLTLLYAWGDSRFATESGVRIGSSLEDVRTAYADAENLRYSEEANSVDTSSTTVRVQQDGSPPGNVLWIHVMNDAVQGFSLHRPNTKVQGYSCGQARTIN